MCNYRQEKTTPIRTCQIERYLANTSFYANGTVTASTELPVDEKGMCIFHSRDIDWKIKSNFDWWLDELIKRVFGFYELVLDTPRPPNEIKTIDLTGIFVIGRQPKKHGGATEIIVRKLNYSEHAEIKFDYAEIADTLRFEECDLGNTQLSFNHAIVNAELFFSNVKLGTLSFNNARLNGGLLMNNCDLSGYGEFGGMVVRNMFQLSNMHFGTHAFFNSTNFACESVFIEKVDFLGKADFGLATFQGDVEIQESNFEQLLSFSNARFNGPVCFTTNQYEENVQFTSSDSKNKVFYDDVRFVFVDKESEVQQRLIFDNVNYYLIGGKDRAELAELERINKVTIGSGCIKYRVQTPLIHIDAWDITGNIARELAYSFTNYFISFTGKSLGVEFVDKRIDSLTLFYYTDENITQRELIKRLKVAENGYWSSGPPDVEKDNPQEVAQKVDQYVSKYAIIIKIAMLKERRLWSESDTKKVLEAVGFVNTENRALNLNISINQYIDTMKIGKIVAQPNSQVNIAEVIKHIEFTPQVQPFTQAEFDQVKAVLTMMQDVELEELRKELAVISADNISFTVMEKIALKLNVFAMKHGSNIADSLAASTIFEVLKSIFFSIIL